MKKQSTSLLLLLLTAIIWGFAFVAQLVGGDSVGAFTFNGVRFLLGAVSLLPVMLIFEKDCRDKAVMKTSLLAGVLAGSVLFIASSLQQFGIILTGSAGKSGFITGLYTVIVPIIVIFFGRKTPVNTWIGAALAVIGLYFVSFSDGFGSVNVGDAVLLIGAVMWAVHILVIDIFGNRVYSLHFALTQFFVCGILCLICALIFEDISFGAVYRARIPILYTGIMSSGIAYTCQILGQKNANPTAAAIVLSTESVFSAIGEFLILGLIMKSDSYQPMTAKKYLGCAIIFCSIIISQMKFKSRKDTDTKCLKQ